MKKKSFALSWGRKIFFGLGWGLTSVVALNYFQSMILPQSVLGWLYFLSTFAGHYGMLISLVYFFLFCPVIQIFPSYYASRIWSVFLLLSLNLLIFVDSYLFVKYRFHLNSFLWDIFTQDFNLGFFGLRGLRLYLLGFFLLVAFVVIWIRGERLWRSMQARFSNPVKNWYLGFIVLSFITSHLIHAYGDAKGAPSITRLAQLFPMHYPLTAKNLLKEQGLLTHFTPAKKRGYKEIYYPARKLDCAMKEPKNIVLIVIDGWMSSEFTLETTPHLVHFATHGKKYENHFSGGGNANDGYFSLSYSLPPTYAEPALNEGRTPVFVSQMEKAKMDMIFYKTGKPSPLSRFLRKDHEYSLEDMEDHLAEREDLASINPFFMNVYLSTGTVTEKDAQVRTVMNLFHKYGLNPSTIFIITGSHGQTKEEGAVTKEELQTPLLVIWPKKSPGVVTKVTSHYDIVPTVVKEEWSCKNRVGDFSQGTSLFAKNDRHFLVSGDYKRLGILDFKHGSLATVRGHSGFVVRDLYSPEQPKESNRKEILSVLQDITDFYRP